MSDKEISFEDGAKIVESNGGQRVDVYFGGEGKPDGPNHIHSFVLKDKKGNDAVYGADGRDGR